MPGPNGRFDLDAKRRARAAASDESARTRWGFHFGGREFSIAPQRDWPANGKRLLDQGDFATLLDKILDDPAGFWALNPTMGDVEDLFNGYGEDTGVGDLPESDASPPAVSIPM